MSHNGCQIFHHSMNAGNTAHLHLCDSVMKVLCEGKRKKSLEELSQEASHYSSCQWLYLSELCK